MPGSRSGVVAVCCFFMNAATKMARDNVGSTHHLASVVEGSTAAAVEALAQFVGSAISSSSSGSSSRPNTPAETPHYA